MVKSQNKTNIIRILYIFKMLYTGCSTKEGMNSDKSKEKKLKPGNYTF